ncbi:hypothetical protein SAMN06272739_3876 [Blastococcus haudaquaticus]|uniref:Uncharacterized protein n=1 Tax=Blastococcus haudaquaticus TaxID=1938745 RepID=A0A286H619_9ACTN|nr:hypothetical protein SAMN06272739_3876 [Blastococcus haudaquaticus]
MRLGRRRDPAEEPYTWPYRGTVRWLPSDEGGRTTGPPRPGPDRESFAAPAFVRRHAEDARTDTFLVRGFDSDVTSSPATGRWLVPGLGAHQEIRPGDEVVVTDGGRAVAHFLVEDVDD